MRCAATTRSSEFSPHLFHRARRRLEKDLAVAERRLLLLSLRRARRPVELHVEADEAQHRDVPADVPTREEAAVVVLRAGSERVSVAFRRRA